MTTTPQQPPVLQPVSLADFQRLCAALRDIESQATVQGSMDRPTDALKAIAERARVARESVQEPKEQPRG